jgi:hypothetical protein
VGSKKGRPWHPLPLPFVGSEATSQAAEKIAQEVKAVRWQGKGLDTLGEADEPRYSRKGSQRFHQAAPVDGAARERKFRCNLQFA